MTKIKLFISHSSKDEVLAKSLISFLKSSFIIETGTIRCSSIKGYHYDFGTPLTTTIKKDISGAITIVLVTSNISLSEWVMFETGLTYALSSKCIVVIPNIQFRSKIPSHLAHLNDCSLDNEKQIGLLIDEINSKLKWQKKSASAIKKAKELLNSKIKEYKEIRKPLEFIKRSDITNEIHQLQWKHIEQSVNANLTIWGWSCMNVLNGISRGHFIKMLQKGIKITLLIQDPLVFSKSPHIRFGAVCNWEDDGIPKDVKTNGIDILIEFKKELPANLKSRFKIKMTSTIITWSGVGVDIDKPNGLLQIEFYHYGDLKHKTIPLGERPNLILSPISPFYIGFKNSLKYLLKNSNEV